LFVLVYKFIINIHSGYKFNNYAHAEVIYESATMGPTGQTEGYLIDNYSFLGSRFYIGNSVQVTAIGGHLFAGCLRTIFLGQSSDWTAPTICRMVYHSLAEMLSLIRCSRRITPALISVRSCRFFLKPGYYGLVFGSGLYGATGTAYMPNGGQNDMTGVTYFFWALLRLFVV